MIEATKLSQTPNVKSISKSSRRFKRGQAIHRSQRWTSFRGNSPDFRAYVYYLAETGDATTLRAVAQNYHFNNSMRRVARNEARRLESGTAEFCWQAQQPMSESVFQS